MRRGTSKLTTQQRKEAPERYEAGETLEDLGARYGVAAQTVARVIRRSRVRLKTPGEGHRLYTCNNGFFDTIKNQTQAYWLGFIAADGSIAKHRRALHVKLRGPDRPHLEALAAALEATNPIYTMGNGQCGLVVHSDGLVEGLFKHGVHQRKEQTLEWPSNMLHPRMLRHYLRGYIDGDGCFSSYKRANKKTPQMQLTILGSKPFLIGLEDYLLRFADIGPTKMGMSGAIHRIQHTGNLKIARIAGLIYKDARIYLPRKREKVAHLL